jgi:hypothetical protein
LRADRDTGPYSELPPQPRPPARQRRNGADDPGPGAHTVERDRYHQPVEVPGGQPRAVEPKLAPGGEACEGCGQRVDGARQELPGDLVMNPQ